MCSQRCRRSRTYWCSPDSNSKEADTPCNLAIRLRVCKSPQDTVCRGRRARQCSPSCRCSHSGLRFRAMNCCQQRYKIAGQHSIVTVELICTHLFPEGMVIDCAYQLRISPQNATSADYVYSQNARIMTVAHQDLAAGPQDSMQLHAHNTNHRNKMRQHRISPCQV